MVTNFYEVAQDKDLFPFLKKMVDATSYSRVLFNEARTINQNPDAFSPLKKAWAFRVLSVFCYSGVIGSGMKFDKGSQAVMSRFLNKKRDFSDRISNRLEKVYIENEDALKVIKRYDNENALIFCDPPYITND